MIIIRIIGYVVIDFVHVKKGISNPQKFMIFCIRYFVIIYIYIFTANARPCLIRDN